MATAAATSLAVAGSNRRQTSPVAGLRDSTARAGAPVEGAPVEGAPVEVAPVEGVPVGSGGAEIGRVIGAVAGLGQLGVGGTPARACLIQYGDTIASCRVLEV